MADGFVDDDNRRSGMILDEHFDVFDDQKADDEAMSKETLNGKSEMYCKNEEVSAVFFCLTCQRYCDM